MQEREQRNTESPLSSLLALFLSLTYTLYFPLQHYWHTHIVIHRHLGPMHMTQSLSRKHCPLNPPIWKTLLWVCETVLRCKDVIGRHGECVWESVFFTWMEKYKLVFVRYILQIHFERDRARIYCFKSAGTVCALTLRNWSLIQAEAWLALFPRGKKVLGFTRIWAFVFRACACSRHAHVGFSSGIPVSSHSPKTCTGRCECMCAWCVCPAMDKLPVQEVFLPLENNG